MPAVELDTGRLILEAPGRLFASPNGTFQALIYMHRYTPSTVSVVLNEYLREFKAKLEAAPSKWAAPKANTPPSAATSQ